MIFPLEKESSKFYLLFDDTAFSFQYMALTQKNIAIKFVQLQDGTKVDL